MRRSVFTLAALALPAILPMAPACKSTPEIKPYEVAGDSKGDLLEAEVEADDDRPRARRKWKRRIDMNLPKPPSELSHIIDGKLDDWSGAKRKRFREGKFVVDGEQFWDGAADAGVSVSADSDAGHVYFAVDVTDDTVIDAASVEPFADGVVLWLRDPKLAELRDELPTSFAEQAGLHSDLGILFTPDGQFWLREEGGDSGQEQAKIRELYREGIHAATLKTDRGYRVEIALKLGTLRQVASIPMPDLAFRVEVIDGDEPKRRGEQTELSTLPPLEDGRPRFALLGLDGWLPYASLTRTPPRRDTLGRWKMTDGGWAFDAFEVPPKHWQHLAAPGATLEDLDDEGFDAICNPARNERKVLEAWESKTGSKRVALVACGTRATDGTCPAGAETHLLYTRLTSTDDSWTFDRAHPVNEEPMKQCPASAPSGSTYYEQFSLVPLGMIGSPIWAIGWHQVRRTGGEPFRRSGIWFINSRKGEEDQNPGLRIGDAQTSKLDADYRERTYSTSLVYLTDVDNKQGLDVCEIETVREQICSGRNRDCYTPQRGVEKIAHIKTWMPDREVFERYMMSKHRNCQAGFDFGSRDNTYLLLHRGGRLGVVRSPSEQP